jgi:phospholipid/cholesterol/gamma-HCH transport system substrate-binding protein
VVPGQILQPLIDASFKKRGIDPVMFWGDAGLPAGRFPDPNAARFPNGAPAPGPAIIEGTPENPGPGILKGSPCSYTPPPDVLPRPGDPLPCAHLTQGPFGGPEYGPPNVVTSDPNPNGPGFTPGVPAAAIPGQMPPDMPGAPAPLPPAPPGARTVPVGPLPPQGPDFTPAIAPLPPALNGPPPPPGPGPNPAPAGTAVLPGNPPFLPPLSQGQGAS